MRVCASCSTSTPIDETGRYCPECGAGFPEDKADPTGATAVLSTDPGGSLIGTTIDHQFVDRRPCSAAARSAPCIAAASSGSIATSPSKCRPHEIAADPVMAQRFAREARSAARDPPPRRRRDLRGRRARRRPAVPRDAVDRAASRSTRSSPTARFRRCARSRIVRDDRERAVRDPRRRRRASRSQAVEHHVAARSQRRRSDHARRLRHRGVQARQRRRVAAHRERPDRHAALHVARAGARRAGRRARGSVRARLPVVRAASPARRRSTAPAFEVLLAHLGTSGAACRASAHAELPDVRRSASCATLLAEEARRAPQTADEVVDADRRRDGGARRPARGFAPTTARSSPAASADGRRRRAASCPRALRRRSPASARRARWWIASVRSPRSRSRAAGFAAWSAHARATLPRLPPKTSPRPSAADEPARERRSRDRRRTTARSMIHADRPRSDRRAAPRSTARIEIKNKLGQPVSGRRRSSSRSRTAPATRRGFAAAPRRKPGHYGFHYTFPHAGRLRGSGVPADRSRCVRDPDSTVRAVR